MSAQWYLKPQVLEGKRGNNAFSYEERALLSSTSPMLMVPAYSAGTLSDVKLGKEIVFEEVEGDRLMSFSGLSTFVEILSRNQSIFIFDNHNHAYYFWAKAKNEGRISEGATLIHVDQHKDMRDPGIYQRSEEFSDLEKVANYTNEVLNVGNFIVPAQKVGLIGELYLLDAEMHFAQDFSTFTKNTILDIDLDIFAPELSFMDQEMILSKTKELIKQASVITIATSPFFMDQELALAYLHKLLLD